MCKKKKNFSFKQVIGMMVQALPISVNVYANGGRLVCLDESVKGVLTHSGLKESLMRCPALIF